ncbi:MAG: quinolinate synthase NadA [Myxococcales bacterium]|nr:quinolinate synthase NadA [Myxococcales bacterium]
MNQTKLVADIKALLKEHHGLWLAHNYQRAEIQDAADLTGDSLALSIAATRRPAELILFCGVHFMAESAAILSPEKQVVLPHLNAGCPMADMIDAAQLRAKKAELGDGWTVVTYVNSSAAVKAESDVCCTSANAARVADTVATDNLYFVPDQNLAQYVAARTTKHVEWWPGYCHVHHHLRAEHLREARAKYPDALVVVHPECRPEVTALADRTASTSGMLKWAATLPGGRVLVGTEIGLLHPLRRANPRVEFIPLAPDIQICGDMKLTTLENILEALHRLDRHTITVEESVRVRARRALDRMIAIPAE